MTATTANTSPIFQGTVGDLTAAGGKLVLTAAMTTVSQILYTAGEDGALVDAINVHSLDGTARDFEIIQLINSIEHVYGTVTVPLSSGTTGAIPTFNLLDPLILTALQVGGGLPLSPGTVLKVRAVVTVSGDVTFTAQGGNL